MAIRISRYRAVVGRGTRISIGDTLSFVEDGDFLLQFRECGLNDDDLEHVQLAITATPSDGDIVPVSRSVRDMFYRIDEGVTVTIRYVYLEPVNTVILLAAYYGDGIKPMSEAGSQEAESYVDRQLSYFSERHTR